MKYRFECLKCQASYEYYYYPNFPWNCFNCQNDTDVLVTKLLDPEDIYQAELELEKSYGNQTPNN